MITAAKPREVMQARIVLEPLVTHKAALHAPVSPISYFWTLFRGGKIPILAALVGWINYLLRGRPLHRLHRSAHR